MKIQITGDRDLNLTIPTNLICSRFVIRMALKSGRLGEEAEAISSEASEKLMAELKRIKKKYGEWELVEIHSADGEHVILIFN